MPVPRKGQRCILYISESPNGESDGVTQALRDRGAKVEVCGDVYRGLARLGRSKPGRFDAVVLCLDVLTSEEYSFIAEAGRCAAGVPVYVHAGRQAASGIARALALGARAAVDGTLESMAPLFEEPTAVRVPWRHDDQRPVRKSPEQTGVSDNTGFDDGPLLTAEEIESLLYGDEGSAGDLPVR